MPHSPPSANARALALPCSPGKLDAMTLELVVARCTESLSWLRRVPSEFTITVYDKGGGHSGGVPLPNAGREAHTYLHHLAERRDRIADITVFVQGHPFDHAPDLHRSLRDLASGRKQAAGFHWLGFLGDTDDPRGHRLFVPWSKNPERRELDLDGFHRALIGTPGPPAYRFFGGAQFAVTRETALSRPPGFYARGRELALTFPLAAHCFERCWDRVFGVDGTAGRWPADQPTAYFKPIRRLGGGIERPPPSPLVPGAGTR